MEGIIIFANIALILVRILKGLRQMGYVVLLQEAQKNTMRGRTASEELNKRMKVQPNVRRGV